MQSWIAVAELLREVLRVGGQFSAATDRLFADLDLTAARWQALCEIARVPVPLPISHLARGLGLSRQAMRRTITEMAGSGMIAFRDNPNHRRAKLVVLTPQGRAIYEQARRREEPWIKTLTADMDPNAAEKALRLLLDLRQRFDRLDIDDDAESE